MSEWVKWNGGECPVDNGAVVLVRFREGGDAIYSTAPKNLRWGHYGTLQDIISYRVISENSTEMDLYRDLRAILDDAFDQSANGKGKERHANDLPWSEQPIIAISRLVGDGGVAFQAIKKITEAQGMAKRGENGAAYRECLGAIVYTAALAKILKGD